jgi:hypothetical protein
MRILRRSIILMTIVGLINSAGVMGQDSTKSSMQTIFGGKKAKCKINYLGIYVAPEFQYGQLDGRFTTLEGASVRLQVNKKWGIGAIGFGGEGSETDTTKKGGYFGGLKLEYTPKPDARVHVSFPLMVGMGETGNGFQYYGEGMRNKGGNRGGFDKGNDHDGLGNNGVENGYAVIQPGIALEANLFRYARVFAGANYRFAFNSAGSSSALQGFSTNAGLKIGIFDYSLAKKAKKAKKENSERRGRGRRMWR